MVKWCWQLIKWFFIFILLIIFMPIVALAFGLLTGVIMTLSVWTQVFDSIMGVKPDDKGMV